MRIRRYEQGDGEHLKTVFSDAVLNTGPRGYSEQQVRAWAARADDVHEYDERAADGRTLLVAVDEQNNPVAYGDLEQDGHVDHLFCHPDAGRRGVASALYAELEKQAREWKLQRLYVEASEIARPFFAGKGFTLIRRNDFDFEGTPIHNYIMEKFLTY
jgi:putative acetyltransferase